MNTPITDAVYPPEIIDREYAQQGETYGWGTLNKLRNTARRLEADRAALMEALEECHRSMECEPKCTYWHAKSNAATALAAARANFPTP